MEGTELHLLLAQYERSIILGAMAASNGNQRHAAELLGILPTTLNEKLKRLGLRSVRSGTIAFPFSAGAPTLETLEEFRWRGRVPRDGCVEILTVNGDIVAELATSDEVEVVALKKRHPGA